VFVTDADADARPLTLAWYPGTGTFLKTERTMRIRLAEKAGTSAPGVAHAFELGSNHWFSVITPLRLAGKPVTVSLDGKPVAEGRVSVVHGRAGVCLNAVLPPDRRNVVRYEVAIDGQKLDPIAVADLEQERGESALPMRYQMPEIITSTLLPAGKFEDATAVQHLLGPCDTKVTYYNEMFAKVPAADSTGLYGAVAEIQPRFFQPPLYRFFALARPSGDVPAKSQITDTNFWMHAMRRQAGLATTLKYWLELPQDAGKDPARKWPLFVLLHGAGERGKTPEHFKGWAGYPRGGKPETFIIAVPACPKDTTWSIAQLDDMISDLVARYPVDTDRIYMAGHSMGGNGCWQMLATFPDRFAGGIICAAPKDKMDANLMERFKDVPIWIFHGAKDDAAPVAHARRMASTFESVRGRFRYTENAQDDHGTILDKAFGQTMVYDWLLQQVRGKPSQPQGEKPSGTRKE
jgi:predicted esterase